MIAATLGFILALAAEPDVPSPPPSVEGKEGEAVPPPAAEEKQAQPGPDGAPKAGGGGTRERGRWREGGWQRDGGKRGRVPQGHPDRNRERWSHLAPEERDRLRRRYDTLRSKLPPERWEEIRRDLRAAPPEKQRELLDKLNKMAAEGEAAIHAARWVDQALRSIPPEELARLRELPREKRAEEIAKLVEACRTRWRAEGEAIARATFGAEEIRWLRSVRPPFRVFGILAGKVPADGKVSPESIEKWKALSSEKRRQAAFWLLPPPPEMLPQGQGVRPPGASGPRTRREGPPAAGPRPPHEGDAPSPERSRGDTPPSPEKDPPTTQGDRDAAPAGKPDDPR
ncbi:MAG: hypothetical protein JXP34_16615 [Planctomycetes bacterium]|nr:hypothetical protein [Planctomycetota bacterium]